MKKILAFLFLFIIGFYNALANDFSVENVEIKSNKEIEVKFNQNLAEDSQDATEFMITKKSDGSEIQVESIESISENTLKVNLAGELETNTKYELVVIFAANSNGDLIENGASGEVIFTTPESFLDKNNFSNEKAQEELNYVSNEEPQEELNSAPNEENNEENKEILSNEENMTKVETGTKEVLLILLALLLAFLFVSTRKKA